MRAACGWLVVVGMVLGALAGPAAAIELEGFGVRGGVSFNPDQIVGGVHADVGHFAGAGRFQSSLELGLGNGVRLLALNLDALYSFAARRLRPFAGGGVGLQLVDVTDGIGRTDGVQFEPALNLVGGVRFGGGAGRRYLLEARLAVLGDAPDLKLVAGIGL